jgi:hypothetical protein
MQYKRTVARIGLQLLRWFLVDQKYSVATDGMMPWILATTERVGVGVDGQETKT